MHAHLRLRRLVCTLLLLTLAGVSGTSRAVAQSTAPGQQPWPQIPPVASYRIEVTLDPETHQLAGSEMITYDNRSSDPLPFLIFHLYLNAFRDQNTLFFRESGGQARGFGHDPSYPGWIEVDSLALISQAGQAIDLLPTTLVSETLMTTTLPQPVLPGESVTLTVGFRALLPRVYARTGFAGDFYMVGQWFPKLAVYLPGKGWKAHRFHANSEFFADFGTYDVAITLPQEYIVGATGLPTGHEQHADDTATHSYHGEAVIDFAWAAWPSFQQAGRQVGPTEVLLLYDPAHEQDAQRYLDAAERALTLYGDWYGPYPYPRLTLVDVPDNAAGAGGMEYPTLVTLGTLGLGVLPVLGTDLFPEMVTAHEIAHQWWQSTAASNEHEEPWLDEGLAEYSSTRLMEQAYGPDATVVRLGPLRITPLDWQRMQYLANPQVPIYGRASDLSFLEYATAAYARPALALTSLERTLGEERWMSVLRTYYQRYRFQHPTTDDFLNVLEEQGGKDARSYFEGLLFSRGVVDYAVTQLECRAAGEDQHCEITVERLGQIALPVEVEIAFADGQRIRENWDGRARSKLYAFDGTSALLWAQVDPERKLPVDVDWLNNSLTSEVQIAAMTRISSPWFHVLQQIILFLGGLW